MDSIYQRCLPYLRKLCVEIPDRSVGSEGNRTAARFFEDTISGFGWLTEIQKFEAVDWKDGGASLEANGESFEVFVSPYSQGCDLEAELLAISNVEELAQAELNGKIALLHGEIAIEQLMPKNFVFYNPEEHRQIVSLLEAKSPSAIICATGRNPSLAGGVYPFPLIEDGDFEIPSVYMTEEQGARLLLHGGERVKLISTSRRIPGSGWNVIARKGPLRHDRIVVTAHIDAKKGTAGALDNASGVVVLLLLADLMSDYAGEVGLEIVALNGEDYYAASGQMAYIASVQDLWDKVLLNINIDGAGYQEGLSAFSFYGLSREVEADIRNVISHFKGITVGAQWVQGDHSIFIQAGRPALAVSSQWFTDNIDTQQITHTPKDRVEIVDCSKLVEIAQALNLILKKIG